MMAQRKIIDYIKLFNILSGVKVVSWILLQLAD